MAHKFTKTKTRLSGFTLIEVLVVVAIIGALSSITLSFVSKPRNEARDIQRIQAVKTLQIALELYLNDHGTYPLGTDDACNGGWDSSANGSFIHELVTAGYLNNDILDPNNNSNCGNFQYHRYHANQNGCVYPFYVLEIINMEATPSFPGAGGPPHPKSPGFRCPNTSNPGHNIWNTYAEYVVGRSER